MGKVVKEVTRNDPTAEAPIMMITANNGFIEQSERYAFDNAGESLKKYILLQKGELAYNHGASKLRPFGSCFALTTAESARIPFVYHCFSAENQNAEFLSIELNGSEVESQLRKIVSSGARMDGLLNISFDEYSTVTVLLPDIKEQEHIADFFRNLDHLITLHQRKFYIVVVFCLCLYPIGARLLNDTGFYSLLLQIVTEGAARHKHKQCVLRFYGFALVQDGVTDAVLIAGITVDFFKPCCEGGMDVNAAVIKYL